MNSAYMYEEHESIDISANYYSNISSVVESAVYEACHGYSEHSFINGIAKYSLCLPERKVRVEAGWRDAVEVADGDVSEMKVIY